MESGIKKGENPIQKNPSNPRNPKRKLDGMKNVPEDKEEPEQLTKEIESMEKQLEAAKPYQAPIKKPKKSDNRESPDGVAIMDELDAIQRTLHGMQIDDEPDIPEKVDKPEVTKEFLTFKDYIGQKKEFLHNVGIVIAEKKIYISDPTQAPPGANVQVGPHGGHYYDSGSGGNEQVPNSKDDSGSKIVDNSVHPEVSDFVSDNFEKGEVLE